MFRKTKKLTISIKSGTLWIWTQIWTHFIRLSCESLSVKDTCLNLQLRVIAKKCCPMVAKYSSAVKSANLVLPFASAWTLDLVSNQNLRWPIFFKLLLLKISPLVCINWYDYDCICIIQKIFFFFLMSKTLPIIKF